MVLLKLIITHVEIFTLHGRYDRYMNAKLIKMHAYAILDNLNIIKKHCVGISVVS